MIRHTTFTLTMGLALATSAAWATDAPKSYTEKPGASSILFAMASPAIASAQRDAGKNTGNRMDVGSDDEQEFMPAIARLRTISCGFPYHCVVALPKGEQVLSNMRTSDFVEAQELMIDNQAYVVVTLSGADNAPDETSLTVFTSAGPYFFVVDNEQDQIDHYVDLN